MKTGLAERDSQKTNVRPEYSCLFQTAARIYVQDSLFFTWDSVLGCGHEYLMVRAHQFGIQIIRLVL